MERQVKETIQFVNPATKSMGTPATFSTKFPTLNKDFSEMRQFQPKPLKPRFDIGLKTPNPEGFGVTLKTLRDI